MSRCVLISCSKSKLKCDAAPAALLYTSRVFRKSLEYARELEADDRIRILSAEHGVIELDRELAPYDTTLNTMKAPARREWSAGVAANVAELGADELVVLAGKIYVTGWADETAATVKPPAPTLAEILGVQHPPPDSTHECTRCQGCHHVELSPGHHQCRDCGTVPSKAAP